MCVDVTLFFAQVAVALSPWTDEGAYGKFHDGQDEKLSWHGSGSGPGIFTGFGQCWICSSISICLYFIG